MTDIDSLFGSMVEILLEKLLESTKEIMDARAPEISMTNDRSMKISKPNSPKISLSATIEPFLALSIATKVPIDASIAEVSREPTIIMKLFVEPFLMNLFRNRAFWLVLNPGMNDAKSPDTEEIKETGMKDSTFEDLIFCSIA